MPVAVPPRLLGGLAVVTVLLSGGGHASGATLPTAPVATFTPNVRADAADGSKFGPNEPQVTVDQTGLTYVTWQSDTVTTSGAGITTTRDGVHLGPLRDGDTQGDTGDVALATTTWTGAASRVPVGAAGSQGVFYSVLGQGTCGAIEIRNSTSIDQGAHFAPVDGTCQPGQVDRNWTAAYTPPQYRGTTDAVKHTWVYDVYHDFAVSNIWVSVSSDGGATFGTVQQSAIQPGLLTLANACNTTPGGIAVDQRGAHAGRVYVSWASSDAANNLGTGCNYTEAQPFDHVYVSYSDDNGSTWTTVPAYNDPCSTSPPLPSTNPTACQDAQEIFSPIAVDDAGNVFVAFVRRDISVAAPQYDIAVAWSGDGGSTWSGGTAGSPGIPRTVDHDTGTHYFPWIAAAGNGAVDVAWYGTSYVQGASNVNKPAAAPGSAVWNVYMGQSLDVIHGAPFTTSKVSDHANYFGDICTVGIFCGTQAAALGSGGDRILLDNIGLAIGPDGGARIAWTDARDSWTGTCVPGGTDDSNVACQKVHLYVACQTSGAGLHGETVTGCGQSTASTLVSPVTGLPVAAGGSTGLSNTSGGPAPGAPIALSALGLGTLMLVRRRRR